MTNTITILWKSREYNSLENCCIALTEAGAEIHSTIIGHYNKEVYKTEYHIKTNAQWHTLLAEIDHRTTKGTLQFRLESDGKGNWTENGNPAGRFKGCLDVDIALTPFTNTLPLNRLHLKKGGSEIIRVIHFNLPENKVKALKQKYTRLSKYYRYENVPNDFEATIEVDELGFVCDYPGLFKRVAFKSRQTKL